MAAFAPKGLYLALIVGAAFEGFRLVVTGARVARPVVLAAVAFGGLVSWAAATAVWSIAPLQSLLTAATVVGLGICGLVLVAAAEGGGSGRRTIELAVALGTVMLATQIGFELITEGAVTRVLRPSSTQPWYEQLARLKPGASVLAIYAWPAALVLWRRVSPVAAAALIVVSVVAIFETSAHAALLALAIGGIVLGGALIALPVVGRALAIGVCVVAVTAPLLFSALAPGPWMKALPDAMQFSAYHRLVIWDFAARGVAERPLFGWGLRTSRAFPGGTGDADINRDLEYDPPRFDSTPIMLPLHPHNGFVQIWLELGLVGLALGLALIVPLPLRLARNTHDKPRAAARLALFAAAFSIACLSYGLWQSWWMALLWLAVAQSATSPPEGDRNMARER